MDPQQKSDDPINGKPGAAPEDLGDIGDKFARLADPMIQRPMATTKKESGPDVGDQSAHDARTLDVLDRLESITRRHTNKAPKQGVLMVVGLAAGLLLSLPF